MHPNRLRRPLMARVQALVGRRRLVEGKSRTTTVEVPPAEERTWVVRGCGCGFGGYEGSSPGDIPG